MCPHPRTLIRLVAQTDLGDVARLDRRCFAGTPPPRWDGPVWWVGRRPDGRAVAYAGLRRRGFVWELCRAGVALEARGEGLQLRLIRARERYVRARGGGRIVTYTARRNLPSARNLIRAGYTLYLPRVEWGLPGSLYFSKLVGGR